MAHKFYCDVVLLLPLHLQAHYKNSHYVADYITFDYHEEKRNSMKLMDKLKPKILKCMFYRQRNGNVLWFVLIFIYLIKLTYAH